MATMMRKYSGKRRAGKAGTNGFTLVELMIIVSIIAALAAAAIPHFLKVRMTANDVRAQVTLKSIATALENYLVINGQYPDDADDLINVTPPYISNNYFTGTYAGFIFAVDTLEGYEYVINAVPTDEGRSGSQTYTITTGGIFDEE